MKIGLIHFNHTSRDNLITWPDMRTAKWKPNYGDFLVSSSILRQIHPAYEHVMVSFGGEVKERCDVGLIRGSTYLFRTFDYEGANATIDSFDCPVTVVGLGAQHYEKDVKFLDGSQDARSFIARLNEKASSISVRGQFTAEVVDRLGGKNIRITGCPSVFYTRSAPTVTVPELLHTPFRSLGISIHAGLGRSIFCRAPDLTRALHGEMISWGLKNTSQLSVFEQGVPLEYDVCDRELDFNARLQAARTIVDNISANFRPEALLSTMVSVKSIEEWVSKVRDLDAVVGFRFHGNMVGLLQGRPCFYLVYDSRMQEFCELYELPFQTVEEDWSGEDMVRSMVDHDWGQVNSNFSLLRSELSAFYAENGIKSVLGGPADDFLN